MLPWNVVVTGFPEAAVFLASKCNIVRAEAGAPAKRIHDCSLRERERERTVMIRCKKELLLSVQHIITLMFS